MPDTVRGPSPCLRVGYASPHTLRASARGRAAADQADGAKLPSGGLRLNASKSESRLEATMYLVLGAIDGTTRSMVPLDRWYRSMYLVLGARPTICPRKAVPFTGVTGQTKPRCCPSVDTLVVFDRSAFGDLARRGKRASSRGRQGRRSRGARGRSGCSHSPSGRAK